ncbi:hypothetical protein WJX73_002429 [Symbiochloris irregularis]|uniref:Uncharacterized protein n=1 Tax=Symbiochloris irregularis TaxID=706552 RepID=A0AAW1NZ70_9CHLO
MNLKPLWLALAAALVSQATFTLASNSPVILVPGLAGSVLQERLNRTSAPAWYCDKTSDWQTAWLSLSAAARPVCLLDDLAIFYDPEDKRYKNQTGVDVRAYDFGGLEGVQALDPDLKSASGTYDALIKGLDDKGYTAGQDLFGAPYDFRLAADGLTQVGFFEAFKALIQGAVDKNEGKPAVIVGHSMGCLVMLYFLSRQLPAWRAQYVHAFISVSAPYLGSVTALKGSISGDNFDITFIPHDLLRPLQSTLPSGPWLFPAPELWGDKVLVQTQSQKYKAADALQMLQDLNLTQQASVYDIVHRLTVPMPALDIPVHCIHGKGVETEDSYFYDIAAFNGKVPPAPNKVTHSDGDGTVNIASLQSCKQLGKTVEVHTFNNASHLGILRDDRAVPYIVDIIANPTPSWWSRVQGRLRKFSGVL